MATLSDTRGSTVGNLEAFGRSVNFGIDEEDVGMILDILANRTYTNKIRAVVREYLCNSFDAHVEAGVADKSFVVTAPTIIDPVFKVRDFGAGLSTDEVEKIYVKIAKSTKRKSNAVIGTYGIGSKAAFCYSDSFTVTSWNNGICSKYIAQIDGERRGRMICISSAPSDEPSGIEISVAVKTEDCLSFEKEIVSICRQFPVVPTCVNIDPSKIKPINKIVEGSCWYIGGMAYEQDYHRNSMKAVCGNVEYELDLNSCNYNFEFLPRLANITFVFKLGEVDVPPSREGLEYTAHTIESVIRIAKTMKEEFNKKILDTISSATNILEAVRLLPPVCKESNIEWKGVNLTVFTSNENWSGVFGNGAPLFERKSDGTFKRKRFKRWSFDFDIEKADDVGVLLKDETKRLANRLTKIDQKFKRLIIVDCLNIDKRYLEKMHLDLWPKDRIVKASEITPDKITRIHGAGITREKLFAVVLTQVRDGSCRWRMIDVVRAEAFPHDPPDGLKVWAPIKHGKVVEGCVAGSAHVLRGLANEHKLPSMIYGMRESDAKKLGADWIRFNDWYSDHLIATLSVITNDERRDDLYPIHCPSYFKDIPYPEFQDLIEANKRCAAAKEKILKLNFYIGQARKLGIWKEFVEENPVVDTRLAAIYEKYPMLKYLSNFRIDTAALSDILAYIKERKGEIQ